MKHFLVVFSSLTLALNLSAADTQFWEQKGYQDFDKGTLQGLSLRSDGKLLLAPQFRQVCDPELNYIWALVEDSRGNVFVGGGSPGKVVRIRSASAAAGGAKPETVFEVKDLEIHALTVDAADNLYAATSPDPKIYKISPDGKASVFFEPEAKYVWALAFDPQGNLLVATGDKGELYRVNSKGEAKLFFNSEETHARSIAVDKSGNVIVGTDPSGLILRISPSGEGFVLYQAAKKEVTAVAIGADGSIYAAAVGNKQQKPPTPAAPAPPQPQVVPAPAPVPRLSRPAPPPVAGGTEVYRIFPDGEPRQLWASKQEVVYALAFDSNGKLLLGTGNQGKIFQIDSEHLYTSLLKAEATQITAFLQTRSGALYAASSNLGGLLEIGRAYETEGSFESEVFDARHFARWGRVFWQAETPDGSSVTVFTRSGNVDNPDRHWSPWSPAHRSPREISASPGARFLQWKGVLTSGKGKDTPLLDTVEIAYFPKNLAPVIGQVEATPTGYRFQTRTTTTPRQRLTLPPLRPRRQKPPTAAKPRISPPTQLVREKGAQGVRWAARDANDDTLIYALYIRGRDEGTWKLLKDKLSTQFYSWDSTAFPDGAYYVKVTASDAPSNSEQDALTTEREAGPFVVDNTPPKIAGLQAAPDGGKLRIRFRATDALSPIQKAEYSLDGSEWQLVLPLDQLSDSLQEGYGFTLRENTVGEHTVAVRVYDRVENVAVEKIVLR